MSDTDIALSDQMDAQRHAAMDAGMTAAGVSLTEKHAADYFGFDESHRLMLDDGLSWIDHKTLNEGARRQYLNAVNRDVTIKKSSGDAVMRIATGDEKASLLKAAVVGWNLTRSGQPVQFNTTNLTEFLMKAPPTVVDEIHKAIVKANPWLTSEVTIEDIDKEIAELQEARAAKILELEGKAGS